MERRKFLKRAAILGTGVFIPTAYAIQVEPFWLEFVKKKMPIKNLPDHLHGNTLIQISDIHVGDHFDSQYFIDSFKAAKAFEPDFVVYTGDYVNRGYTSQLNNLDKVMQHALLGKKGTVGVLGNHDYGKNWSQKSIGKKVTAVMEKNGVKILRNQQRAFNGLNVIGIDDRWGPNFYPKKAMKHYSSKKANLVLCHNPDVCDMKIWNGYQGWILAGHTHGGQCKPPFLPPPLLPVKNRRYTQGEIDLKDGRTLYINRALGSSFQIRFNVRPEITVFEMVKA